MFSLNFTNEYMFYTLQGEGRFTGRPSLFLRFSGCNLRCEWRNEDGSSTKCDTPYSSYNPDKNRKSIDEVMEDILEYPCKDIVITGGEPYLQKNMLFLIDKLVEVGKYITVETNATIYFETKAQFISMSPKLSSSCVSENPFYKKHHEKRWNIQAMQSFIEQHEYQLKFVINSKEDLDEVDLLLEQLGHLAPDKVYLMPQGDELSQLIAKESYLINLCKARGFNFCPRLHIMLDIQ